MRNYTRNNKENSSICFLPISYHQRPMVVFKLENLTATVDHNLSNYLAVTCKEYPDKVESLISIFGKSILICNTFGNTQTVVCIHFRFLDPEINFGANLRVSCGWSTTAAGVTREPPLPIPSSMANKQPVNFVQLELLLWLLLLLANLNFIVVVFVVVVVCEIFCLCSSASTMALVFQLTVFSLFSMAKSTPKTVTARRIFYETTPFEDKSAQYATQCYSCMSTLYENLWYESGISLLYKKPESFTSYCDQDRFDSRKVLAKPCSDHCIIIENENLFESSAQVPDHPDALFIHGFLSQCAESASANMCLLHRSLQRFFCCFCSFYQQNTPLHHSAPFLSSAIPFLVINLNMLQPFRYLCKIYGGKIFPNVPPATTNVHIESIDYSNNKRIVGVVVIDDKSGKLTCCTRNSGLFIEYEIKINNFNRSRASRVPVNKRSELCVARPVSTWRHYSIGLYIHNRIQCIVLVKTYCDQFQFLAFFWPQHTKSSSSSSPTTAILIIYCFQRILFHIQTIMTRDTGNTTSNSTSHRTQQIHRKTSDNNNMKKANKPLMEKRRRARINRSLDELKSMLICSTKPSIPGHSKWEKADILEMTVQQMRTLRTQTNNPSRDDPIAYGQFISGYTHCIRHNGTFAPETCRDLIENLMADLRHLTNEAGQAKVQESSSSSSGADSVSSLELASCNDDNETCTSQSSPSPPVASLLGVAHDSPSCLFAVKTNPDCLLTAAAFPLIHTSFGACSPMTQSESSAFASFRSIRHNECKSVTKNASYWRPCIS
ncbi:Transcription factor HES-4 [Trichinella sp. T6]|nr:Transcription factor HES-4 [Trichinella sp. T6]